MQSFVIAVTYSCDHFVVSHTTEHTRKKKKKKKKEEEEKKKKKKKKALFLRHVNIGRWKAWVKYISGGVTNWRQGLTGAIAG